MYTPLVIGVARRSFRRVLITLFIFFVDIFRSARSAEDFSDTRSRAVPTCTVVTCHAMNFILKAGSKGYGFCC